MVLPLCTCITNLLSTLACSSNTVLTLRELTAADNEKGLLADNKKDVVMINGKEIKKKSAKKKKNQFVEAKNLASKVQNRINEENRKNVFPETSKEQEERFGE